MRRRMIHAVGIFCFLICVVFSLVASQTSTSSSSVIVNEIIQDPKAVSDTKGEWIELYNAGDADVDINGWMIRDNGSNMHVIDNGEPLVVPAMGYLVLGRNVNEEENGGAPVDYAYSNFTLGNSGDEIILLDADSLEVDRVEYDGGPEFPDPAGASMELDSPELDNNVGSNWHTAATPYGDGDLGTPGGPNSTPLTITTPSLPDGIVGTSYLVALSCVGGVSPYSWSLVSGTLPDSLIFDVLGIISGIPAIADTQDITFKVEDTIGNTDQKEFSFIVSIQEFERGDANGDETINVLDVLATINHILGVQPLEGIQYTCADCNGDEVINVIDALGIVNVILGVGECVPI